MTDKFYLSCYEAKDRPKMHDYPHTADEDTVENAIIGLLMDCTASDDGTLTWVPKSDTTFAVKVKQQLTKTRTKTVWLGNIRLNGIMEAFIGFVNGETPKWITQTYVDGLRDAADRAISNYMETNNG